MSTSEKDQVSETVKVKVALLVNAIKIALLHSPAHTFGEYEVLNEDEDGNIAILAQISFKPFDSDEGRITPEPVSIDFEYRVDDNEWLIIVGDDAHELCINESSLISIIYFYSLRPDKEIAAENVYAPPSTAQEGTKEILQTILKCLTEFYENNLLCDKIWLSDGETLLDYIENSIDRFKSQPTAQEDKLIEERDHWEEKATDLADAVGKHFGADVGEHTSANCPIEEAHKVLDGEYKTNEPTISKLLERVRDGIELVRVEMELYEAATDEEPPSFHLATIGLLRSCEAFLSQPTAQKVESEPEIEEGSETKGMNLGERIAHVGGRENAAGYIEFGSVMAVKALIDHVLRDIDRHTQPVEQGDSTWSGWACQYPGEMPRLYGNKWFAEMNWDPENGDRLMFLSSPPEPRVRKPEHLRVLEEIKRCLVGARQDGEILDTLWVSGGVTLFDYIDHEISQPTSPKVPQSVEEFISKHEFIYKLKNALHTRVVYSEELRAFMAGKALVPGEPTEKMLMLGAKIYMEADSNQSKSVIEIVGRIYRAMTEAAKEE